MRVRGGPRRAESGCGAGGGTRENGRRTRAGARIGKLRGGSETTGVRRREVNWLQSQDDRMTRICGVDHSPGRGCL